MEQPSNLERFKFCGDICRAAQIMGIGMKEEAGGDAGHAFAFHDPAGSMIYGEAGADRPSALFNACVALQDYLCGTAKQKEQENK